MRSWASTGACCSTLCTLRRLLRTMGGVSSLTPYRVITERDGHQYSGRREPCTQKTPSVQSVLDRHTPCSQAAWKSSTRSSGVPPSERAGERGPDAGNSFARKGVGHSQRLGAEPDVCALFSPECEHILRECERHGRAILTEWERSWYDVCAQTL